MIKYKINITAIAGADAFSEASREELRALIALIGSNGTVADAAELAVLARISKARASASLVLWEEAGILTQISDVPTITEEFERRMESGEIEEITAGEAARTIRDDGLADMISECAKLLGRATLNTTEIKKLSALSEQYSLSPEYILTLAAHMAESGKLNISRLADKAIKLTERDIADTEALEAYLKEKADIGEAEYNFRGIFGIFGRALSKTEKEAFRKWSREYGYFIDIVGEAYDIAVSKVTRGYVNHADKTLTRWFETGCRTLADCRARYEADEAERKAEREKNRTQKNVTQKKPEKERYGNFDAEDAFMKALNRSYGNKD